MTAFSQEPRLSYRLAEPDAIYRPGMLIQVVTKAAYKSEQHTHLLQGDITIVHAEYGDRALLVGCWREGSYRCYINRACVRPYDPNPIQDHDVAKALGIQHCGTCICRTPERHRHRKHVEWATRLSRLEAWGPIDETPPAWMKD